MQRMLSRLPNSSLADLQKGDAVMIVSTSGDTDAGHSHHSARRCRAHSHRGAQSLRFAAFPVVVERIGWGR